jgi:hypothetical protein
MHDRQSRLRQRAIAVARFVEAEGAPPHLRSLVRLFAELAPEVLALGPVPAGFAARILAGLASDEPTLREEFQALVAREAAPPASPTITNMLASELIRTGEHGVMILTAQGRAMLDRLNQSGAHGTDGQRRGPGMPGSVST